MKLAELLDVDPDELVGGSRRLTIRRQAEGHGRRPKPDAHLDQGEEPERMALDDWDCHESRMTWAFWDWNRSVEETRGYFDFTYSTCNAAYEVVWERAGREIAGTEYDQYDVFEHYVDILPISSTWMLRSSVIKEVVGAFDVYVEKAINEVRRRTGQPELPATVRWMR